jgi:uncharacterized membrane protein (TIGR02234 family)
VSRLLSKRNAILAVLLGAAVSLIGWSQNWLTLSLSSADIRVTSLEASGQSTTALPAGLALVAFATGLVLLTSRSVLAYVIAVINAAAGVGIIAVCLAVLADPVSFLFKQLQGLSGIADQKALRHLVSGVTTGAGLTVCAIGGLLVVLGAVLVLASAHRWPKRRSRYDVSGSTHRGSSNNSSVETLDAWDEMSRGADPTS